MTNHLNQMKNPSEAYHHFLKNYGPAKMTIKQTIETHINSLEPGIRLHANELWWTLFRYKIARNSVTRGLGQLAKEGKVKKSNWSRGRNSEWKVL